MIYLDHAASTPINQNALEILNKSLMLDFANPSSSHRLGSNLKNKIEIAREFFLDSLNAREKYNFIFTGSATESNNTIIKGHFNTSLNKTSAFLSIADHPSMVEPVKWAEKTYKTKLFEVPLKINGEIDQDKFLEQISHQKPSLVCLSQVNNHSGHLYSVESLSEKIKKNNPKIFIHVDSSQAYGKFALNLKPGFIDSVTMTGHKMGGPKGVSGFFLKKTNLLEPLLIGGGQENALRASTLNPPLILAWHKAAEEYSLKREEYFSQVMLINKTLCGLLSQISSDIKFPFEAATLSPYILLIIIPKFSSDIIMRHLEEKNIYVSSSSACSSKIKAENEVFAALKIDSKFHKNVLRISFSYLTSDGEVREFANTLGEIYKSLLSL